MVFRGVNLLDGLPSRSHARIQIANCPLIIYGRSLRFGHSDTRWTTSSTEFNTHVHLLPLLSYSTIFSIESEIYNDFRESFVRCHSYSGCLNFSQGSRTTISKRPSSKTSVYFSLFVTVEPDPGRTMPVGSLTIPCQTSVVIL